MMTIFLLSLLLQVLPPEISWQIRSGLLPDGNPAVAEDDPNGITGTAAALVAAGEVRTAEAYWENPNDPPANRYDLLSVLVWVGRYRIPSLISTFPVPPDLSDAAIGEKCAAVCALGWMNVREDGLFHGAETVSRGDIVILSGHFTGLDTSASFLRLSELEELVP